MGLGWVLWAVPPVPAVVTQCWGEQHTGGHVFVLILCPGVAAATWFCHQGQVLPRDPRELELWVRNESLSCVTSFFCDCALTPGACALCPLLMAWLLPQLGTFWGGFLRKAPMISEVHPLKERRPMPAQILGWV